MAAATIETDRIDAGHFAPISGPGCSVAESGGSRTLRIPIKVSGNGKPGHLLVNLAVDVEIVVDENR